MTFLYKALFMGQNNHPNIQFSQQPHFALFPHYNLVLNV